MFNHVKTAGHVVQNDSIVSDQIIQVVNHGQWPANSWIIVTESALATTQPVSND